MALPDQASSYSYDVIAAGGGPVGLTLAVALAARGFRVAVADDPAPSGRVFFVSYGCWRIWRALGLETALLRKAEPVTSVEAEGAGGGAAFLAGDAEGEPVLGYMIAQDALVSVLTAAADASPLIDLMAPARVTRVRFDEAAVVAGLSAGPGAREARASLIVGCDGARSVVRQAAGIRFEGRDYPAKAISAIVELEQPHGGAARQVFLAGGPLAVLPLAGGRANLVWTERAAVADALMALDAAGFEAELARRIDGFIAAPKLAGPRHAFPVALRVADRFHGPRAALAGDSAHQIHPLAGQGLNLGLKDVAALVDVIGEAARVGLDFGGEAMLAPYTRWRRADVVAAAAAIDGFARVFSGPAPVRAVAGWAMGAAGRMRQARGWLAREAGGDLGELPSLMRV